MRLETDYMAAICDVFARCRRQGPGDEACTLRALAALPPADGPRRTLDMGCGTGSSTLTLARAGVGHVTGLDVWLPFLRRMTDEASRLGLPVSAVRASMDAPPLADGSLDLIWAEGCVFVMGVEAALQQWRGLLRGPGHLALSDLVWLTETPAPALRAHWDRIGAVLYRTGDLHRMAETHGWSVLDSFILPIECWDSFYDDMEKHLHQVKAERGPHRALADMQTELDNYRAHRGQYGYEMLVLQKRP